MITEPELLNERLDRLATVLDEIMPNCANLVRDSLELLKEQRDRIGVLERTIERMPKPVKLLDVFGNDYSKIVRCKNCKHRPKELDIEFPDNKCPCQCSGDPYYSWYPDDEWFCAEGER